MNKTILIVEDEQIIAIKEANDLRRIGYAVLIAGGGEEAADLVARDPSIDLVLMDIDLGRGMDGTTAAEKVLELRDIPIIFLSSHTESAVIDRTESISSYGYVMKSAGISVLNASIKMAFRLHETRKKLQISEERYHAFIRQSTEGIYRIEMDRPVDTSMAPEAQEKEIYSRAVIAEANEAFLAMHGFPREEIIVGKGFADFKSGRYDGEIRALIGTFVRSGYRLNGVEIQDRSATYSFSAVGIVEEGLLKRIWATQADISGKKKLESLTLRSERLYPMIFSNAPIGIFVFDRESTIVECNDEFVHIIGSSRKALTGFNMRARIKNNELLDALEGAFRGSIGRYEGIYSSVTAEKSTYVRGSFAGIFDDDGNFVKGIGIFEDITERKKVEVALRESEEKYRALVENAREAIVVARDGYLVFANSRAEVLSGYSIDELKERPFTEMVHPGDRELVMSNYLKRVAGEKVPEEYAFRMVNKSGETRWVEIRVAVITWMGSPATLNMLADISGRKRMEEALVEREAKFRTLFNANPFIITISTIADGRFIDVNESFQEYFGYSAAEAVGKTSTELNIYPDPRTRQIFVEHLLEKGSIRNIEAEVRTRSGEIRNALFSADMVTLQGTMYLIVVMTDITRLKRTEEALARSNEEKDLILSELQHRVKNNLGVIVSLLSLEMTTIEDERIRHVFMDSISRIQSMASIYEQLYQTSSLDRVDLRSYVEKLARTVIGSYSLNPDSISLRVDTDEVWLDMKRAVPLGLVLNELITNAMKYAYPAGGGGELGISLKREGGRYSLTVTDDGKGFSRDRAAQEGSGMGLQIVEMLAKQLRGELSMQTNRGTAATLSFPVDTEMI